MGDIVRLRLAGYDAAGTAWFMFAAGARTVVVKITDNAAGGGKYYGVIYTGTSTAEEFGDEAQPEGLTTSTSGALILNLDEDGLESHWLEIGSFVVGKIVGQNTDLNLAIVNIACGHARTADPQAIGVQSIVAGTDPPPSTDTWARGVVTADTNYGDCPIIRYEQRIYSYAGGGNFVLLTAIQTPIKLDASGRTFAVDAEESRYMLLQVEGDNQWIQTKGLATPCQFKIEHLDPSTATSTVTIQGGGIIRGSGTFTFDAKGHYNASTNTITLTASIPTSGGTGSGLPAGTTNGDVLVWNGTVWVPTQPTTINIQNISSITITCNDDGTITASISSTTTTAKVLP